LSVAATASSFASADATCPSACSSAASSVCSSPRHSLSTSTSSSGAAISRSDAIVFFVEPFFRSASSAPPYRGSHPRKWRPHPIAHFRGRYLISARHCRTFADSSVTVGT